MSKFHKGYHKYRRTKVSTKVVYRCILPNCPHYTLPAFIVGKMAICHYCGEDFLITSKLARRERVHCSNCTQTRSKKKKNEEIVEFLKELSDG